MFQFFQESDSYIIIEVFSSYNFPSEHYSDGFATPSHDINVFIKIRAMKESRRSIFIHHLWLSQSSVEKLDEIVLWTYSPSLEALIQLRLRSSVSILKNN